jgi:hypothetical protein
MLVSLLKPKQPGQTPFSSYTSGPTPIADLIEKLLAGTMIVIMTPLLAAILIFGPATLFVYGFGGLTGLTAAWAELVLEVSTTPHGALPFSAMLVQNLVCGAIISLLLALPSIRRALDRYNLRGIAQSVGTSTAIAALQLSAAAVFLHLSLGLLVAAVMSALGMLCPMPLGAETVVPPETLAFFIVSGGAGGGWPPTADALSVFAIFALSMGMLAGALFGATLWCALGFLAHRLAPAGASQAAGESASALGVALANAVTRGRDQRLYFDWRREVLWTGLAHGALSGALFAMLVLAGAMLLGIG